MRTRCFALLLLSLGFLLHDSLAVEREKGSPVSASRCVTPTSLPTIVLSPELQLCQLGQGVFVIAHNFPFLSNSVLVEMPDGSFVMAGTPWTPEATELVLAWIQKEYGTRKLVAINTGYHVDNLGGNEALLKAGCPVYGSDLTVKLLAERAESTRQIILKMIPDKSSSVSARHATLPFFPPDHVFPIQEGLRLSIGGEEVQVLYHGPSQAPDKVAVYFPGRRLLFGSCMLLPGNKPGNVAEADLAKWTDAIRALLKLPIDAAVSSHGPRYAPELVQHTLNVLLKAQKL